MQAKLYVLNGQVINVGEWEFQHITDPETNEITGIRNPIPDGVQVIENGNYGFDDKGQVILVP